MIAIPLNDFKDAEKNISCIYMKNSIPDVPGWEDFINGLNHKYNNPNMI